MHKAVDYIIAKIAESAKKVETKEQIQQVATLSAQDEAVGTLIAEIMDEVGKDGVVTVEEGKSMGLTKEVVMGMQFDQGYLSPYFVSDYARMEAVLENPYILVTDKKISSLKDIIGVVEQVAATGKRDIVLIADDVDGEAL